MGRRKKIKLMAVKVKVGRTYNDKYGQKMIVINVNGIGYHIPRTTLKNDKSYAIYKYKQYLRWLKKQ